MRGLGFTAGEVERVLERGVDLFETYGYSVRWIPGAPWAWLYNEWIAMGEKEAA